MASCAVNARRTIRFLVGQSARRTAAVAGLALLLTAGAASAERAGHDPRLSATLVGALEPGTTGRLAVRWDGEPGALLDAWVDLDGDGRLTADEVVVQGRPLLGGIEVIDFEVAANAMVKPEPKLWVDVRQQPRRQPDSAVEAQVSDSREGCAWQPGFSLPGFDREVLAIAVFDDGTGPALYAGGVFLSAGGVKVNQVARWDGTTWFALSGPSGTGVDGSVYALAVFDDGTGPALYAGGSFNTAGGLTVNRVARWDGTAWSALSGPSGTGVDGSVYALAVFDDGSGPALYAGGVFSVAGGVTVNRVARWNGTAWSPLTGPSGTGVNNSVYALAVFDSGPGPALYAGGGFTTAGGVTVNRVARWNGTAWSALTGPSGTGASSTVYALAVFDDGSGPSLYAGGDFTTAGGVTVSRVARWNGTAWSALTGPSGTGASSTVYALAVFDDGSGPALYAGGDFTFAGGVWVNRVARWDGTAWSALNGPSGTGVSWTVLALAVFDDGAGPALYAGGDFTLAGGVAVDRVARWDGTAWSTLNGPSGAGVSNGVYALTVFDDGSGPALYAGGWFGNAGGVAVNSIARWNGTAWSALSGPSGTGVNNYVSALAVFDDGSGPALFAGGDFVTAGGVTVNRVARWDGTAWSGLSGPSGTGADSYVSALAVFDDGSGPALYAGGNFVTAGGVTVNRVARWDSSAWWDLSGPSGTGVSAAVSAFAVFDDGSGPALYAGGNFVTAGGVTVDRVARWNGTAWSALSGPSGTGVNNPVEALAVLDNGTGPALYAGGVFTTAGGVTVNRVARWDGSGWSALSGPSGTGVDWTVMALGGFDDGAGTALYAGGSFTSAGGVPSSRIAAWRCPPDLTPPSDPTQLVSTTHTPGEWSSTDVVEVEWSGASDGDGSGLAGYSYLFDTASGTLPDTIIDLPQRSDPHSTTSAPLADGQSHWFHLRTCDTAGNCSTGLHLGPFWVDATAPDSPSSLSSTTHTPSVWSTSNVIGVEWGGAGDSGGSGLAGYSVLFDTSPTTEPDSAIDVPQGSDPHSTTSGALTDGQDHWFHLRTCDTAGNCSAPEHLGPFWVDAAAPSNPTSMVSTSHTAGVWSSSNVIGVQWSGAGDSGGSGLTGYSVLFDTSPTTEPDSAVDLPQGSDPHSTTSGALTDGQDHWFHLRTADGAGNWSSGVHLGPFWIDTTAPSGPFGLTSTSHTPYQPSSDRSVNLVWSPAVDTGSGIDGYAVGVSASALWLCDRVKDLEEEAGSLSTPDLTDNPWYVHLCPADNLGNWGAVVSAGPFVINGLFADGFETGGTTLWSQTLP